MQRFPSASISGGQGAAGGASASSFSGGGGGSGASSSTHQAFPSAMVQRGQGGGENFAGKPPSASGFSWLDQVRFVDVGVRFWVLHLCSVRSCGTQRVARPSVPSSVLDVDHIDILYSIVRRRE